MKQLRETAGLSKAALAHEMGVSEKTYGRYEAQGEMPRASAGTYADVVGLPLEDLLSGSAPQLAAAVQALLEMTDSVQAAAEALAETGAAAAGALAELRPLLALQQETVAQLQTLVEELRKLGGSS